ncbi:hypothetical protein [Streptomyces sp. NPDC008125]|uniref:hypothetical protein n=1 Tax=Streptomyces sp. NPDC008125 TaxID=3364811 RepID=UPI0036E1ABDD
MSTRRTRKLLWEPGYVPAPGGLLDWRDSRHYDHRPDRLCTLCGHPTSLRSHSGEPTHKTCAETWLTANPEEARRTGRYASDAQPKGRRDDDHA